MSGHWSPLLASGSSSSFAIPKHQISPTNLPNHSKSTRIPKLECAASWASRTTSQSTFWLAERFYVGGRMRKNTNPTFFSITSSSLSINSASVYTDELRCGWGEIPVDRKKVGSMRTEIYADVKGTHRRQEFDMGKDDFPILDSGAFKVKTIKDHGANRKLVLGGDTLTVVAPAFTIHVDT
ncbi:hypothetical protein C8R42DRAFT_638113 [Lentinula raphanica]|nr:hypothetical protein C8R42DRAFT_638113 [Lentinula raphanica]